MGPIDYPATSVALTTNIRCITFQKIVDLMYTAEEACNHTERVSTKIVKTEFRDHQIVTSKWFVFAKQIT